MKKLILIAALCICGAATAAKPAAHRVVSCNIRVALDADEQKGVGWSVRKKICVEVMKHQRADIFCLQETKLQQGQIDFEPEGYYAYWNYAEKKGYSGTAILTKQAPLSVQYGLGLDAHDHEGRLITAEYPEFYLVCCYTPNSQDGLKRLPYRMEWEDALRAYLLRLDAEKPVVYCGDLNVAHEEIDIKNPKANRQNAGFSDEERAKMTELLSSGFADTFRRLHPNLAGVYSWWSYRFHARENNAGWRIDYFIVSERLLPRVLSSEIRTDVFGSDHCPVVLELTV